MNTCHISSPGWSIIGGLKLRIALDAVAAVTAAAEAAEAAAPAPRVRGMCSSAPGDMGIVIAAPPRVDAPDLDPAAEALS